MYYRIAFEKTYIPVGELLWKSILCPSMIQDCFRPWNYFLCGSFLMMTPWWRFFPRFPSRSCALLKERKSFVKEIRISGSIGFCRERCASDTPIMSFWAAISLVRCSVKCLWWMIGPNPLTSSPPRTPPASPLISPSSRTFLQETWIETEFWKGFARSSPGKFVEPMRPWSLGGLNLSPWRPISKSLIFSTSLPFWTHAGFWTTRPAFFIEKLYYILWFPVYFETSVCDF